MLCAKSLQSCPTLCDPMNYSPPGSSVCGILQARILEWVAKPSSRGSPIKKKKVQISKWLKIIKRNEFCWYSHLWPSHTQNEEQVKEFAVLSEIPKILDYLFVSRPSPCFLGMDLFYVRRTTVSSPSKAGSNFWKG